MTKRLVQWVLSKLLPYNKPITINEYGSEEAWYKQKLRENEEFYGRQNGRILRKTKMYREVQKW